MLYTIDDDDDDYGCSKSKFLHWHSLSEELDMLLSLQLQAWRSVSQWQNTTSHIINLMTTNKRGQAVKGATSNQFLLDERIFLQDTTGIYRIEMLK